MSLAVLQSNPGWTGVENLSSRSKYADPFYINDIHLANRIGSMFRMPILAHGSYRTVFKFDDRVVKVAMCKIGREQNLAEYNLWQSLPNEARQYFVPCFGIDKSGIAIEAAYAHRFANPMAFQPFKTDCDKILERLYELGIEIADCENTRWDQWGFYEGKLVILDYGDQ